MPLIESERNNLMNKDRDITVDILRGLGIISMIWNHYEGGEISQYNKNFDIWFHAVLCLCFM